ncbi:MAG: sporulation protein YabP [Clostridiaceae bacterium]|nr:sporulation protein YabP [Clostridiaceae bacterium]
MEERRSVRQRGHSVVLESREKLSVSGVEHVNNFNSELVVLETIAGVLTIKGENLDVSNLNIENGNVSIGGTVYSMVYSDKESLATKSSGFFSKMFK